MLNEVESNWYLHSHTYSLFKKSGMALDMVLVKFNENRPNRLFSGSVET